MEADTGISDLNALKSNIQGSRGLATGAGVGDLGTTTDSASVVLEWGRGRGRLGQHNSMGIEAREEQQGRSCEGYQATHCFGGGDRSRFLFLAGFFKIRRYLTGCNLKLNYC